MKSSNKPAPEEKFVLVGRVTGAHGIHGGLRVHSYAESIELYRIGETIRVCLPNGSESSMIVEWVAPHGRGLRMGLESVGDRNQAEHLAGALLYVEKSRLPALEEDTYYWHELIGLQVYDTAGTLLGSLDEVIPTPANDVYVIQAEVDGCSRELLIPAIGAVIRNIDLEGGVMVVDPPEGL
ncbi:ribosome maturation factor RimM [Desulfosarcina variabilis]|uniref:ribosome maturation factor RimM n=1 Tax=Desulfosarcina variabilis TaxID=2300 RepID=UPI003AFA0AA5